ncbi:hypothetical protein ACH495_03000 [Micromonospora sp. NPDC018662]|uniref:hypothetical protein n=1 Tax=Micromonospora sp. NPDC018662 TaxID=3364238 RepID=UPI0037B42CBD
MIPVHDLAASAAVVVAAGTYILTSRRSRALDRATLVRQYSNDFVHDSEALRLFIEIDYGRFRFDPATTAWLGGAPEIRLIRLLDLFNSLGHGWKRGLIGIDDIHGTTLGYAILRAHQDAYVRTYITYVDNHDINSGTGAAFEFFRLLAVQLDRQARQTRNKRRQSRLSLGGRKKLRTLLHPAPAADVPATPSNTAR